jgi:hypothetical protein
MPTGISNTAMSTSSLPTKPMCITYASSLRMTNVNSVAWWAFQLTDDGTFGSPIAVATGG